MASLVACTVPRAHTVQPSQQRAEPNLRPNPLFLWLQAIYCIVTKSYNQFLAHLLLYYMLTLLALFGNFFVQKYLNKSAKKKAQ
jgi:hypothetical protein